MELLRSNLLIMDCLSCTSDDKSKIEVFQYKILGTQILRILGFLTQN